MRRLASCLFAALLLAACTDGKPVRIGFIGELTGNSADLGEASRNGVLLAIEQTNQAGGVNGRPIEVIARDTGASPESARQAAEELVAAGVVAVIGTTTTGMTKAIMPTLAAARIIQISPTASATDLYGLDDYLFRINWTARDNATLYAKACIAQGYRRISGLLNENNRAFSERWFADFTKAFTAAGGSIVGSERFDSHSERLPDIVNTALAGQPDALILVANAVDSARLAQLVRKQEEGLPLIAAEWASTDQLIELGGKAVEGMLLISQFNIDDRSPNFLAFRERYKQHYGREPAFASVLSHDRQACW